MLALSAACTTHPPPAKARPKVRVGAQTVWVMRENDPQNFNDGPGLGGDLGYEFGDGALRPGIEIGAGWSQHELAGGPSGAPDYDVFRGTAGARLSWYSEYLGWDFYGRGGWFWRRTHETVIDGIEYDDDGSGPYAGVGANFWVDEWRSWGPFVTYSNSEQSSALEEWIAGFSFQIYL